MNLIRINQVLICLALLIAPIAGGYVSTELQVASPSFSPVLALFGSAEAPMLGFVLPIAFVLIALIITLTTRKVIQVPFPSLTICLAIFGGAIVGTIAMSSFQAISFASALQWLAVIATPIAIASSLGRGRGPKFALLALTLGCGVIAAMGILEYASAGDPNWRAFCNWVNPNAAAGMLLLGFFPAVSMVSDEDRIWKLAGFACAILIGCALLLTQSKGGLLAGLIGGSMLASFNWFLSKSARDRMAPLLALAAISVVSIGLTKAMQSSAASRAGSAPTAAMGRLGAASETSEQSNEFRKLLWKSSIALIKKNPVGSGPGTFRYESSRPGLVSQTHHAHQGYLQIAVETGVISLIAFLALIFVAARESLRGIRKLPPDRTRLIVGVFGSIASSLAHNFVDSDLQHFGSGFTLFALLGIVLLLAHDGTTPEFFPKSLRWGLVAGAISILFGFVFFAQIDAMKAQARGAVMLSDPTSVELVESLKSRAPNDPETWTLAMQTARSADDQLLFAQRAAKLGPSMRNERQLARLLFTNRDTIHALDALGVALQRDPNNLSALLLQMQIYKASGDEDNAIETARRLVEVENSPSYKIRAIPESIPTQTFEARRLLADAETNIAKRADLLLGAARGYASFANRTVPQIVAGLRGDPHFEFAGDSAEDAQKRMTEGKEIIAELRSIQRISGVDAAELESLDGIFDAALEALASSAK